MNVTCDSVLFIRDLEKLLLQIEVEKLCLKKQEQYFTRIGTLKILIYAFMIYNYTQYDLHQMPTMC